MPQQTFSQGDLYALILKGSNKILHDREIDNAIEKQNINKLKDIIKKEIKK